MNVKLYVPVHTTRLGSQTSRSHLIKQSSNSGAAFKKQVLKDKAK